MAYVADQLEIDFRFRREHHEDIRRFSDDIVVLDYDEITIPPIMPIEPSRLGGQASMAFCLDAIEAAKTGLIDAIVTAPISKTSWQLAGHGRYPGHTELLADKTKSKHVAMMFVSPRLKVVLATIHIGLMEIRNRFTIGCVFNPIELADRALRQWFGYDRPKIAVAALNPHAGESGHFGDEEVRIISPAILMATEAGIDANGARSRLTRCLSQAAAGRFDCVVAMYHDQGLIPVKLLGWQHAVNLTLGLPIIRTSPDHGTAFDIAGKGKADPSSMTAAINLAIDLAARTAPVPQK